MDSSRTNMEMPSSEETMSCTYPHRKGEGNRSTSYIFYSNKTSDFIMLPVYLTGYIASSMHIYLSFLVSGIRKEDINFLIFTRSQI